MKNMLKKTAIFLFALMFGLNLSAQIEETTEMVLDKPDKMFWFFLNVTLVKNKETQLFEYIIKPSGGFYNGDEEKFKKALWGNKTANRLAVGPFWNESTAKTSQKIYMSLSKTSMDPTLISEVNDDQVHWYYLKVKQQRTGYKLEPTAARVATGTAQEYYDALKEGLFQEMIAVGPFNDYSEAEDSKALYRAQEDFRGRR